MQVVDFRIGARLRERMDQAAAKEGLTRSDWIRLALLDLDGEPLHELRLPAFLVAEAVDESRRCCLRLTKQYIESLDRIANELGATRTLAVKLAVIVRLSAQ